MIRAGNRALLAAVLLAACGGGGGSPPEERPAAETVAAVGQPPVVMISIDTLRSDRLPAYGYGGVATPAIDRLAGDAILFERVYSHTPLTLPSHVSILTGRLPSDHGVRDNQGYPFDPGSGPYLPRELGSRGYAVGAAVSAAVLAGESGLGAAGFDFYDDRVKPRPGMALGGVARGGAETLAAAEPWLRSVAGRPFFLLFHLFEPHLPYDAPEPWASRYPSAYDAEIAAADAVVGRLLALLEELGVYREAVVVLLSDHGEGLGDHGEEEHGIFLYREALQVPLLLKLPGNRRAGERVAAAAQLVDLYPTLADLTGISPPPAAGAPPPGGSLLRLATTGAPRAIYSESFYPRIHYGWSELTSLIEGRFHFIEAPEPELYDLTADPEERRNLAAREPAVTGELRRALAALGRELEPAAPAAAATRRQLAALGYLGGAAATTGGPLPDPKTKLATLADLRRGFDHFRRGELDRAVPAFRRALAENPGIIDGWEYLALALAGLGRLDEAAAAYRRGLEADPGAAQLLGGLAVVELERGDPAAAAAVLERLVAGDPANAEAWERLSLARLRQRRWPEARAAAERATALDDRRVEAWNNLGVALYSSGGRIEALEAWERALALDPLRYDVLYNLGTSAAELGRSGQARRALTRFVDSAPPERYAEDLRRARVLLRRLPG